MGEEFEYEARIARLEGAVLYGNGKDGLVARMATVEKLSALTQKTLEENGKKLDSTRWLVAMGIGIIVALQFVAPLVLRGK